MKISVKYLKRIGACDPAIEWFDETYGDMEIEVSELISSGVVVDYDWIRWLMFKCPEFRTAEMLEYYKSKNPKYDHVSWLMAGCPEFRTAEMLKYYKSLNPEYDNVSWLMARCPEFEKGNK